MGEGKLIIVSDTCCEAGSQRAALCEGKASLVLTFLCVEISVDLPFQPLLSEKLSFFYLFIFEHARPSFGGHKPVWRVVILPVSPSLL